jgi:hypothetical protein
MIGAAGETTLRAMTHRARLRSFIQLAVVGSGLLRALAACDAADPGPEGTYEAFATGSSDIVISQVYGGGGNSGAQLRNDYVELFNRGAGSVSVAGWSVQYASSTGSSWSAASLSGTIPAGGYYLVALASSGSVGSALPAADATGPMNLSGTTGKVALVTTTSLLTCGSSACLPNANIRDLVGYGSANQAEGSTAPAFSNTTAGFRAGNGCTDTDNNAADFSASTPGPRNSSSTRTTCGGGGIPDAGTGSGGTPDAGTGGGTGDGAPTRVACTGTFGSAMTAVFGRLDGFLVSIVNINGSSTCRGDDNHIHLQIKVNGKIEDIAVNVESTTGNPNVGFRTLNAPLHGGAWAEGWHTGQTLDYANTLGVHSTSFTSETLTQLQSLLDSDLANANHVSIFATGFDGTGGHDIHREPTNHDGAIVINPTTSNPEYLLFSFSDQTF